MIFFIFIFVLFFVLRILPRRIFAHNDYLGTDNFFHFYLMKAYKQCGYFKLQEYPNIDLGPPPRFYPSLFHIIGMRFSRVTLIKYEHLFTIVPQLLNIIVLSVCIFYFANMVCPEKAVVITQHSALAATILPIFFGPNSGMVFATPRPLGCLFANLFLICLYFISLGDFLYFFTTVAIGSFFMSAMTSRFAIQTAVFIGLIFSILSMQISVFLVLICSFLFSITFGYKLYYPVFKNHIRHIIAYHKVFTIYANDIKVRHVTVFKVLKNVVSNVFKQNLSQALKEIYYSAGIRLVIMNPFAFLALAGGILFFGEFPVEMSKIYFLLVAGMIVSIATMTQSLKFLGESERYLEFGSLFPIFFFCGWLSTFPGYAVAFWLICLYSLLFSYFSFRLHPRINIQARNELISFLNSLGHKKILAFPTYCHPMILFFTGLKVPYFDGWAYRDEYFNNMEKVKNQFEYLYGTFPGPNIATFEKQIDEFNVDYVLFCRHENTIGNDKEVTTALSRYQKIYSNEGYAVYGVHYP